MPGAILDVAHVVVADDDLTWRHFAAGFVLDTLKSQSLALSLVSSGAGAIAEVTRLVDDGMAPEKIAVVTDLHMGDAPDHSGAHVVAYLPSGVRVAVLSGTVSERDLVNLSRTAEVPFIGKGSILPDASPDERALAAERLRAYFEKAPRQPTTLEVKALRELASRPSNVEQANVLIGSIYGELAVLRTKHSDELQQLIATHGAAVSSVLNPRDLSRGNSSRNLHDYKNLLAIWIAST